MKNKNTWTVDGLKNIQPNGLAQKGEGLWNPSTNKVQYIDKGAIGTDDLPVNVQDETFISSHKDGIAQMVAPAMKHMSDINKKMRLAEKQQELSSLAKLTNRLLLQENDKFIQQNILPYALLLQLMNQQPQSLQNFDDGKIPGYIRVIPTIASLGSGLTQLNYWGRQPILYHNTYMESPYSLRGLRQLAGILTNAYPQIKAILDSENRAAYANLQAGGTTGSQRYLGRIGLGLGAMQANANAIYLAQLANNQYKTHFGDSLLQEGNSIATRMQNAALHDWADYVAAHGRKTKGIETSIANIINAINSGYSNEFKYRTYLDTLDLYRQKIDDENLKWITEMMYRYPTFNVAETRITKPQYNSIKNK